MMGDWNYLTEKVNKFLKPTFHRMFYTAYDYADYACS